MSADRDPFTPIDEHDGHDDVQSTRTTLLYVEFGCFVALVALGWAWPDAAGMGPAFVVALSAIVTPPGGDAPLAWWQLGLAALLIVAAWGYAFAGVAMALAG